MGYTYIYTDLSLYSIVRMLLSISDALSLFVAKTLQGFPVASRNPYANMSSTPKENFVDSSKQSPEHESQNGNGKKRSSKSGFDEDSPDFGQYQNIVKEPVIDSVKIEHQRAYKSQGELDRVGRTPPPTGPYHRIPDEPVDLYRRRSAFSPPISQSNVSMERLGTEIQSYPRRKEISRWLSVDALSEGRHKIPDSPGGFSKWNPAKDDDGDGFQKRDDAEDSANSRFHNRQEDSLTQESDRNPDGMTVRARLVTIYDNVESRHDSESLALPSQTDLMSSSNNIATRNEQKNNQGKNSSNYLKEDVVMEHQTSSLGVQEDLEHLFFEPYVNMRDAKVLFPANASKIEESQRPQFKLEGIPLPCSVCVTLGSLLWPLVFFC